MVRVASLLKSLAGVAAVVGIVVAVWLLRDRVFRPKAPLPEASTAPTKSPHPPSPVLTISAQARKNLDLVSEPAQPREYWRTVLIPGVIMDRPGLSDRGVTSPAVGIVADIHAFPGDMLLPGDKLFTLRLFSEYLQSTQAQLFTAKQETRIIDAEIERLSGLTQSGAVSQSRIIDLQSDKSRQSALMQAARQDLLTRGLLPAQIEQVEQGNFVSTVEVTAPPFPANATAAAKTRPRAEPPTGEDSAIEASEPAAYDGPAAYEVQELAVELGQQVQAGELLAKLANHESLYIVGHAFKREAPFLEQAAQEQRPIQVEFAEDTSPHWPELQQTFEIRHLSNAIDVESRTFDFFIPLANQSRTYQRLGETFLVWRFRPGQRARLHVPVEKYENVFVLPAAAVVREGPEAFVFRQNGDLFQKLPVHVLHEDRNVVVIANDGSILSGTHLAQNAAASLNRILKSQAASGEQPGLHVHPDGTVHAEH